MTRATDNQIDPDAAHNPPPVAHSPGPRPRAPEEVDVLFSGDRIRTGLLNGNFLLRIKIPKNELGAYARGDGLWSGVLVSQVD